MKQPRGETSALGTLFTFILLIAALGVLWVYSGGPERSAYEQGPFLTMPSVPTVPITQGVATGGTNAPPADPGKTLRDYFYDFGSPTAGVERSPYADYVSIDRGEPQNADPKREYVILDVSSNAQSSVTITGWSLVGSSGINAKIGQAAQLAVSGQVNSEAPITVLPGGRVYITTGRAPSGSSFRINMCSGYLEQFQDYYPSLRLDCPRPTEEMLKYPSGIAGNRACIEFIERLTSCRLYTDPVPGNIGSECQNFVLNQLSYNGCINNHKNDTGFYKNEWRVFLSRDQELWQSKYERIRLLDENGKVIDQISY